jgi:hypothetical protein
MFQLLIFVVLGFLLCLTVHCVGRLWHSVTHIVDFS